MAISSLLSVLLSLVLNSNVLGSSHLPPNVVDTGYAKYAGNRTFHNTVAYLGIPYAEPPLGNLRFRAPLPLNTTRVREESNGAVIDASVYPEFCIQGALGAGDHGGAGSEDCLKVNIYTPAGAKKGSNLPVLFYIHGGGYVFGNPRNWPFEHWILQSPNVVIVSVYYRLDSLGFLSVPELSDPKNGDLNAGFLDQIQALKWVKRNIVAFGGDPSKVTINGESAGGGSVELHLVAHEGERLFSAAIAQSVYRAPTPTPAQQEPLFEFYAQNAGCGQGTVVEKLTCLRNASVSALALSQDAAKTSQFNGTYRAFHPVIDGKVILEPPTKSILAGRFARVPLIVGATSNETVIGGADPAAALVNAFPQLTSADVARILEAYPETDFTSASQRFQVITGESILICARPIMGTAFGRLNNAWTYRYNQANPTSGSTSVGHAAENWMMFLGTNTGVNGTTTFTRMTPAKQSFAAELIAYWLSFVRAQNPNTFKLARSPVWGQYARPGLHSGKRVVLQQTNATRTSGSFIEAEPKKEFDRCAVVASLADKEQN